MAGPEHGGDLAELYRAIDRAVDGVKELMAAHFATVNAKLEPLNRLTNDVADLQHRVTALETEQRADSEQSNYRRVHRPTLVIAALGLLVAVAGVLVNLVA